MEYGIQYGYSFPYGYSILPEVRENTDRIDTSVIDAFRQGVSIRTAKQLYQSGQPKFWSGRIDHKLTVLSFGSPGLFDSDSRPFDETKKRDYEINAVIDHYGGYASPSLIGASGSVTLAHVSGVFGPDPGVSGTVGDIRFMNGVIEPLQVRKEIYDPSHTYDVNIFRGSLGMGGLTTHGSDLLLQYTDNDGVAQVSFFREVGPRTPVGFGTTLTSRTASALTGSLSSLLVQLSGSTTPRRLLNSFDDSRAATRNYTADELLSSSVGSREHFKHVLSQMTGSTELERLKHITRSTSGFQFHSTPFGTDSIVFGGLERYK